MFQLIKSLKILVNILCASLLRKRRVRFSHELRLIDDDGRRV